jgi:four helix bundle protein
MSELDTRVLSEDRQEYKQSYKDLLVWQRGLDLVVQVYLLTDKFPHTETYGLKAQLQRAVVSVPSNIAEGQARGASNTEFSRFIRIALGSLAEVDTQLELSIRLGFVTEQQTESAFALALEIRKMLFGLLRRLQ